MPRRAAIDFRACFLVRRSSLRSVPISDLKNSALRMFYETLAAIDIPSIMQRKLARAGSGVFVCGAPVDLAAYSRIYAVAIGKASVAMVQGLARTLAPDFHAEGIVVSPSHAADVPEGFRAITAGHPVPNQSSFDAARTILDLLGGAN